MKKWVHTDYNIVIIENTQHPYIHKLIEVIQNQKKHILPANYSTIKHMHYVFDNIELISYNDNYESSLYGKGHGEKASMLYASKHSKLILDNFVIKITGRYFISNLEILTSNLDINTHVICKYMSLHQLVDTRVWGYSPFFLQQLEIQEINDKKGVSMERGVARVINHLQEIYMDFLKIMTQSFQVDKTLSGMQQIITKI